MIKLDKVTKIYYNNGVIATGFSKISLDLNIGEFVVIVGESGSGKSTLLNVISGLDKYEEGEMYINGKETSHYSEEDMQEYRRRYVSNIFQAFNLINSYTVRQNVELALILDGKNTRETRKKVNEVLKRVGLWELRNRRTTKLSGGQKQRVAIARALVQETPIIVCDEPTGNLDSESAKDIFKLLREVSEDKLVVVVTHNFEQVKDYATRVIKMKDGSVYEDTKLKEYKVIENGHEAEYSKMNFMSLLKVSLTNAISTPIRLLLALAIFTATALLLFNEIAALHQLSISGELDGTDNAIFADNDTRRIVVSKQDKSTFTDDEINKIKNIKDVDSVFLRDQELDIHVFPEVLMDEPGYGEYSYSLSALLRRLDSLDPDIQLVVGRMPKAEDEVLVVGSEYDIRGYLKEKGEIQGYYFDEFTGERVNDFKIVGYADKKYHEGSMTLIYMNNKLYNEYYKTSPIFNKFLKVSINEETNTIEPKAIYINDKVPEGTIWITNFFAVNHCDHVGDYVDDYDCSNNKVFMKNKTAFYTNEVELPISQVLTNKNSASLLDSNRDFEYEIDQNIYINSKDFEKLAYTDDIYQISAYAKEDANVLEIADEIKKTGNFYAVAIAYTVDTDTITYFAFRMFSIIIIVGCIAMYSLIAYFLLKFILKSRIAYYAVIRMLGGTIKVNRRIVRIELLIYATISFILSGLGIFLFVKCNILHLMIPNSEALLFVTPIHYLYVYLALIGMSLIIARRFAKKVFTESMINTYNMEV